MRFHDLFCGAGGSTLGATTAGAEALLGANHWQVACDSYAANHAGARVDCADVCTVDPRRYPRAELLLASPECTHHSYARGRSKDDPSLFDPQGDQAAERSRATMWDVVRFSEVHRYDAVIVENVAAATKWGGAQGQKLRGDEYGSLFQAWLYAMGGLGYEHEVVHLNSMMVGVPQSRDRIYVVFWRRGARRPDLDVRPVSWCPGCERLVRGRQQWKRPGTVRGAYGQSYIYACETCTVRVAPVIRPAAAAIDWSLPAQRIGDRARALRPATLARIRRGLTRLGDRPPVVHLEQLLAAQPTGDPDGLLVQVGGNRHERPGQTRAWGTDEPMPVVTGTADRALVVSNMANNVPRLPQGEPMATVTSGGKLAMVVANRRNASGKPVGGAPMHTLDTKGAAYLVEPTQIDLRGENAPRSAHDEPLSTVAAGGQHHGLAYVVANYSPGWVRPAHERELGTTTATDSHALLTYRGHGDAAHVGEPAPTITTVMQHALVDRVDPATIPIEDCSFRMLEPHELQLATGFPADYRLQGTKRDRVAQVGNAVTAPVEAELVQRVMETIA